MGSDTLLAEISAIQVVACAVAIDNILIDVYATNRTPVAALPGPKPPFWKSWAWPDDRAALSTGRVLAVCCDGCLIPQPPAADTPTGSRNPVGLPSQSAQRGDAWGFPVECL